MVVKAWTTQIGISTSACEGVTLSSFFFPSQLLGSLTLTTKKTNAHRSWSFEKQANDRGGDVSMDDSTLRTSSHGAASSNPSA